MRFMNAHEITEAAYRFEDHSILGPATRTLVNLSTWADCNSDGWAYWPKPCRAAAKLQELVDDATRAYYRGDAVEPSAADYRKTLAPVKAFLTRQGVDHAKIIIPA